MDNTLGIPFEERVKKETIINRMDTRARVILALLLAIAIAVTGNTSSVLLLAYSVILVILAQIPRKVLFERLLVLDGILLALWVTLPLSAGGEALYSGPLTIYKEGIKLALSITVKANSAFLSMSALLSTIPFIELFNALEDLKFPRKLLLLVHFTFRYAHVIAAEAESIYRSMMLRGFAHRFSLNTLKGYGILLGMIFVKSYRRADRVMQAMELRGFEGRFFSLRERKIFSARVFMSLVLPAIFILVCCIL
jgi:cobalt/nickel transport system permease protein